VDKPPQEEPNVSRYFPQKKFGLAKKHERKLMEIFKGPKKEVFWGTESSKYYNSAFNSHRPWIISLMGLCAGKIIKNLTSF
jgi:hypothetical protein